MLLLRQLSENRFSGILLLDTIYVNAFPLVLISGFLLMFFWDTLHCEAKSNDCKPCDGMLENGNTHGASIAGNELEARTGDREENISELSCKQQQLLDDDDKRLEVTLPLSFVTTSSHEEEAGNEDASFLHLFPGYTDVGIPPWQPREQLENPFIYMLNHFPRKEVPVGPDHQCEVPTWDPSAVGKYFSVSNNFSGSDWKENLRGTCIIPRPGVYHSSIDQFMVGRGRTDCSCPDVGSVRCVQQHVKEAREFLRVDIGEWLFKELGFYNMGEEVALNWTFEDERLFYEVVFANPAYSGRNFWKFLGFAFPNRTKEELVSYYFNVFMLRRRAVQNRSFPLHIDSDDDKEHKGDDRPNRSLNDDDDRLVRPHGYCCMIGDGDEDEDDDSSLGDQGFDSGWVDDYGFRPGNVSGEEGNDRIPRGTRDDKFFDK
ncbi:hypothetical protein DH2020_012097 [Rehmannia glutinosa]|uniref:AT-rich interactive domain-containing protein n=1 Tax=Rehmannia glutinosa TaxID=99300 RepID=A0ABR0XF77_REHGL